jgi:hypothetical protein
MILTIHVPTSADPAAVFTYLADFTTTTEWDPGTVSTTLASGDGGVGSTYLNRSRFAGRTSELTYTVVERDAPRLIRLRGENATVTAIDTISIETTSPTSVVTYRAEFTFRGVARLASPFFGRAFAKLRDDAERGLREALARLEG